MIVFDLRCGNGHVFEAWFGSSAAFEDQRTGGLLACPLCDDRAVEKAVMAPNVAAKGNARAAAMPDSPPPALPPGITPEGMKAAIKALAQAQTKALEKSEWVGRSFASRARAMHAGDEAETPIHGQATRAEALSLMEEGVPVAPLPLPVTPPDALN